MIRVNLMGVIYSIEAVLPAMIARKSGHLLAISSLGAFKGLPGESAYCASKAAVNAYMEGLRIALRSEGSRRDDRLPGLCRHADDADGFGDALPDVGRRGRPPNRSPDRPAARRGGSLPAADVALDVADRPAAGRDRRPACPRRARPRPGPGGGVSPMIDLALKMLLDEKVRFLATVLGVGFAAALVLIQVGLFFGLLENASITIERLNADLWVTARTRPTSISATRSPRRTSSACGRSPAWHGPTT